MPATFVATPGVTDSPDFPSDNDVNNNPQTISLRGWVRKANDTPNNDTIQLGTGTYTLSVAGNDDDSTAGDFDIPSVAAGGTLTIVGAGIDITIIDADQIDRVFEIGSNAVVIVRDLTIRNGSTSDFGGTIQIGGSSTLTLERVRIETSLSASGGGAIDNSGSLTIIDSEIVGNTTQHATLFRNGGAILNRSTGVLNVSGSLLDDNLANGAGGAIHNSQAGDVTITNSTLSNNEAGTTGGAIQNVDDGADTVAEFALIGSTLSDNIASDQGGGLFNDGGGNFEITNSTFGFNRAGNSGGAIVNNSGTGTLTNATVSGNFVTAGTIGGIVNVAGTTSLHNTIVANSVDTASNADLDGAFVSLGHNLVEIAGPVVSGLIDTVNSDQVGSAGSPIDPVLGSLQNNGGLTATFALNTGSPAIDAGDDTVAATLTTDQRGAGFGRQRDGNSDSTDTVDIGAFEVQPTVTDLFVDNTTDAVDADVGDGVGADASGNNTLRAAIQESNALAGDQIITLTAGVFRLTLTGANEDSAATGDLDITDDVIVRGAGVGQTIIDGNDIDRVFDVRPGVEVRFEDLTIRFGQATSGGGGGIRIEGATVVLEHALVAFNVAFDDGGGIHATDSDVTILLSTLEGNQAIQNGGGLSASGTSAIDIFESLFVSNSAEFGGGLALGEATQATVVNSTFSSHSATADGAAIFNAGTLNAGHVTITQNTSLTLGGGIASAAGSTTSLYNTIVAANGATNGDPDVTGTFNSLGHNLIGDVGDATGFTAGANGDLVGGNGAAVIDARLDVLADNGGPTRTHALLVGSPARDAADDALAPELDQRGLDRSEDGDGDTIAVADIGAFEALPPPPNAAPVLDNIETDNVPYTENDPAAVITATLTISDTDNAELSEALVRFVSGYVAGQDVLAATTTGTNITATFDTDLGELLLSGADTVANYETVLRSVTYFNTSDDPDTSSRTIEFLVNDGTSDSDVATRDIDVTALVNESVVVTPATFLLSEDTRNGVLVGTVVATVSTPTARIRSFAITDGNVGNVFRIDNLGRIFVRNSQLVDFETLATYSLTVSATDSVGTTGAAVIQIDVDDVAAPMVTAATFNVSETAANGTRVGTVIATTSSSSNRLRSFAITGGNVGNVFRIDNQGRITVGSNRSLDFETLTTYSLTVSATDSRRETGSAVIQIDVLDVGGTVTVTLPDGPNAVTVKRAGSNLQVLRAGRVIASERIGEITDLIVVGGTAGDQLLLDRSLNRFFPNAITIFGGAGNDSVDARALDSSVSFTFFGGSGNDTALGGGGNDSLNGGADQDLIVGGLGDDELLGGDGDDTLTGGLGNDVIAGSDGTDRLVESGNVNFTLDLTSLTGLGNDAISGLEEVALTGGSGNNIIDVREFTAQGVFDPFVGSVTVDGGSGNDQLLAGGSLFGRSGTTHLIGGNGNDTLQGGNGANFLEGGAGNDSLSGGFSGDRLDGGAGNDTLLGGNDNDLLLGDAGNDSLQGGSGDDTLTGGLGDDTIAGGFSGIFPNFTSGRDRLIETGNVNITINDTAMGGLGRDQISDIEEAEIDGGARHQRLNAAGFSGNVTLRGSGGNDTLIGGSGDDSLDGGTGNDVFEMSNGTDAFEGGNGNDLVRVDAFRANAERKLWFLSDTLLIGSGGISGLPDIFDTVLNHRADLTSIEEAQIEILTLSDAAFVGVLFDASDFSGPTRLSGGFGPDTLNGGTGDDVIRGHGGNDLIHGNAGDDGIFSGVNNTAHFDPILGDDDTVFGDAGNDTIVSGLGDDELHGGDGDDELTNGSVSGFPLATVSDGDDTMFGDAGSDDLYGGKGDDFLHGGDGDDLLFGGDGSDTLEGREGDDDLFGQDGDDRLLGREGNDSLDGGNGNDTLLGGADDDTLLGANGSDVALGEDGDDLVNTRQGGSDTLAGGGNGHERSLRDRLFNDPNSDVIDDAFTFDFDALLTEL